MLFPISELYWGRQGQDVKRERERERERERAAVKMSAQPPPAALRTASSGRQGQRACPKVLLSFSLSAAISAVSASASADDAQKAEERRHLELMPRRNGVPVLRSLGISASREEIRQISAQFGDTT
jgi:hypothetical protein